MKAGIHPVYETREFHCYFTGKQKLMDKAGRVDRFRRRYAKNAPEAPTEAAAETSKG
jgi:large subunit ribosomal protein L31